MLNKLHVACAMRPVHLDKINWFQGNKSSSWGDLKNVFVSNYLVPLTQYILLVNRIYFEVVITKK